YPKNSLQILALPQILTFHDLLYNLFMSLCNCILILLVTTQLLLMMLTMLISHDALLVPAKSVLWVIIWNSDVLSLNAYFHVYRKLLKDFFTATILDETIVQILDTFMSMGSPHHWVGYLMPEDSGVYNLVSQSSSSGYSDLPHATKLEQLMGETRAVLLSVEFGNIIEMSLKTLVNELMKDISSQCGESTLLSGMPLAKLLPRIAQIGQQLLKEPYRSRYVQNICSIPEVEQFFTLLYSSTPFL
ncbi:peroxisome biogenesis protein 3-2-like, partial [Olea europaea var. sylvestris]|uniref:peroxisome biogenesis protein 3-2-like n=1 Tax=Olea europaea var. sylvestris TaxID=158386 RepID=UPI000C1D5126